MKERDIIYENGRFWVARDRLRWVVYENGVTHSLSDSAYPLSDECMSIAIARCNYLAKHRKAA